MNKFYQITTSGRTADLNIFGDICEWAWEERGETSAYNLAKEIEGLDVDFINVHIDSYGGEIKEGWGIYNALKNHKAQINTYADGFVCSAALYPFMAGNRRIASPVSAFYFHEGMTGAHGYAKDLRKAADELEIITEIGMSAFTENCDITKDQVAELMANETWLAPEQALKIGVTTEISGAAENGYTQSARQSVLSGIFAKRKEPKQNKNEAEIVEDAPAEENKKFNKLF